MKRNIACVLFVFALLQSIVIESFAAEGEIRVMLEEGVEVTVYKVGEPEGDHHRLSERYGGGTVAFDDTLSNELAAWLSRKAAEGMTQTVIDGTADFSGLEEGLYLVVQTKGEKAQEEFSPFLVTIPWDGNMWQVEVTPMPPEPPQTGDAIHGMLLLFVATCAALITAGKQIKMLTKSA